MTYKTILVHAECDPAAAPRLATAAALARDFGATLFGVGAEMFDWATVSDPYGMMGGEWVTLLQEQMETNLIAAEAAFRSHVGETPNTWLTVRAPPAHCMAQLSRAADLIVAGGTPLNDTGVQRTAAPADLVMLSGRPVLIAPPAGGVLSAKAIVVAWKDTREARRAVADAMPFLKRADDVVVLEVCAADEVSDAQHRSLNVVQHLQRHGVNARALTKVAAPERVAVELESEAQAIGADLIVSGAYGHNRAREWMLGGVTHDLLNRPERFVLLSH
jgi:nucleotide-binding universal stress UspA family protein